MTSTAAVSPARRWVAEQFGAPAEVLKLVEAEVPPPGPGEVTIAVRAAGLNPADYKRMAAGDPAALPIAPGFEVAGTLAAVGPDTEIASGGGAVGDAVLAFRIGGGYATAVTVPARDVFAKPASLGFPEAANLLLAGATAAEMVERTGVGEGDTVLLHGASGAVGVAALQLARRRGARVIGTASEARFGVVEELGGEPVAYGDGLEARVRALAGDGVDAALDAVGTDEASDVSLALVADRDRIVTIANAGRARADGFRHIGGSMSGSAEFRDQVRPELIALAGEGALVVPVARTFALDEAPAALDLLRGGHPGGKLALVP
ncbi:MAG TPA: NADP-dependent oxidoreductase [Baekduia sp.]|uniref:NADP-dependent oxidoreductase n=1 Tax=Baekduia sp. TaxID=2600305 RepID=UPI002D7860AD|nr:NADP-dependent oxidoreductase [Baekduia sp.]HET6508046.1 NADP-dependent oxidoreductase [Baekduia sp.]